MSTLRICAKCHTWNENQDHCTNCGHLLNPDLIRKIELEKKEKLEAGRELDKVDLFLHKVKNSRFILVRVAYYLFYSIWFIFTAIVSFFIAIIAAGPG
jgi:hypothetical protein